MSAPPTLVVLRALGLGDLLTAVPALRGLARAFPHHRRVLATSAWVAPLVPMIGGVDELLPAAELQPLHPAPDGVDVAVNLHGRGPQSHAVCLALRPRRLLAFSHPEVPGTTGLPGWRAGEHEVHRWCRLLQECGVPADPTDLSLPPPGLPAGWAGWDGAVVVHPGAKDPARRWPAERWAAVVGALSETGRPVAITGSAGERSLAHEVATRARLPAAAVLAGRTSLVELAAVVAHADLVLSGDTGVAHLATAFATPSVVLFGPVPPSEWGPPADRPRHVALWAGRRGDPHGAEVDAGLLHLATADVLEAATGLLAPASARR